MQSNDMEKGTKLALLLPVAGLLFALLVLDSLNEVLAQGNAEHLHVLMKSPSAVLVWAR